MAVFLFPYERILAEINTLDTTTEQPSNENRNFSEDDQQASYPKPAEELVRERESTAEEDPLAKRQTQQVDSPEEAASEPSSFDIYGSIRIRYRYSEIDSQSVWGDGGSRFGIKGKWHYSKQKWIFGLIEAGINLLDELDLLFSPGDSSSENARGDSIFSRLMYGGVETPNSMLIYGKNWSTYYQVSSFTDRFDAVGAEASGTFNADTDGGASGTGRADRVLQTRLQFDVFPDSWKAKPFMVNLQFQHGEPIPYLEGEHYGTAIGVSAIFNGDNNLSVGMAMNLADVINPTSLVVKEHGIQGNAEAYILGTRWFNDNWYLSTTISKLDNHEATDEGIYFEGWGWETYLRYKLWKGLYLVSGWNYLTPDSEQDQAGDYQVKYGVLSLRYTFNEEFRNLIYFVARFDDSFNQDSSAIGNVYTIGVRWDLPRT